MDTFNIQTTLNIYPTTYQTHDLIYISRGASATLNFDFGKEVYGFEDTDQLTFLLKQGNDLHWFRMFTYLVESNDETPVQGKTYFTNVRSINANDPTCLQCLADLVEAPETPKANGYFEEVDGNHSWRNTKYIVDSHFSQSSGTGWDYVSLVLTPTETAAFKATRRGTEMAFEVVIRLNTDTFSSLGNNDAVIIEPQHPIAVIDSLYSKLL